MLSDRPIMSAKITIPSSSSFAAEARGFSGMISNAVFGSVYIM